MAHFPTENLLQTMKSHVENFISHQIERDIKDNVSSTLRLITPIAIMKGPMGLRRFFSVFEEYLPSAEISLKSVKYYANKVVYHWQAQCSTASVDNGKCTALFKDGKLVEQKIECEVQPVVLNMG